MKSTLLFISVANAAFEVYCPVLTCDPAVVDLELENPEKCYEFGTETEQSPLYARDCYSKKTQKDKEAI
jgi:hypothetical protein